MVNKISNFVFLILLFLLQSCSGGRIGNFLESSFNNNSNKLSQNDNNEKYEGDKTLNDKKLIENKDKSNEIKINYQSKLANIDNLSSNGTNDLDRIKNQNQNFNSRSYKIFVILKKVDPSFPTENFSKILRSGDINFEIEKIELMPEFNQNKK